MVCVVGIGEEECKGEGKWGGVFFFFLLAWLVVMLESIYFPRTSGLFFSSGIPVAVAHVHGYRFTVLTLIVREANSSMFLPAAPCLVHRYCLSLGVSYDRSAQYFSGGVS